MTFKISLMKIIKYSVGVLFICSSLGLLFTGKPVGILLLVLGIIILPIVSKLLKQKISIWNSKIVRYCSYGFLFLTAAIINRPSLENYKVAIKSDKTSIEKKYKSYFSKNQELTEENDSIRKLVIKEIQNTKTYKALVSDSIISVEYLPVLTAVSNGITYLKDDEFFVDSQIREQIVNSENSEDKLQFFPSVIALARPSLGGVPKDIVAVFEIYKNKFGMYGDKKTQFYASGKAKVSIEKPFDLTPFFAMLDSNENTLEMLYEAKQLKLNQWRENENYTFNYISTLDGYINYLISVYPSSDLLPDDYDAKFWSKYDKMVRERVLRMIFLKDCNSLQNEFDATEENLKRFHAARKSSTRNVSLMNFIDNNMQDLGCY